MFFLFVVIALLPSIKEGLKKLMKFSIKGELQCKTIQKGVKEGPKTRISSVLVFKIDPPFIRKKPKQLLKLKKLYSLLVDLHGRGIRLLVVLEGKGTRLLVL